jgi:hypothetical protein
VLARHPLLETASVGENVPFENIDEPVVSVPKTEGELAPQRHIEQVERLGKDEQ